VIGGISMNYFAEDLSNSHFVNGFRFKGEYRRYFHVKHKLNFYVAGELHYTKYNSGVEGTFISSIDSTQYEDHYNLHKEMYGWNIKWGLIKKCGRHFMFETYAGLGVKYRIVSQTGRQHPDDDYKTPVDVNLGAIGAETGATTTIGATLNFAVGYRFGHGSHN